MAKIKITKEKLKKLIKKISFLSKEDKNGWLHTVDILSDKEIQEVYEFFSDSHKEVKAKEVQLIFDYHLEKDFQKEVNKISNKYIKKINDLKK